VSQVRQLPANIAREFIPAKKAKAVDKGKPWETNRGVGAHILGDTGGITNLAVELILVDTVGAGGFTDMAGAASEHELVGGTVLLGV
jgi:hypothetical protein